MNQQIKHRKTGKVLFEGEYDSLKLCVMAAVFRGSGLRGSDLSNSDLSYSNLRGTSFCGATIDGAVLSNSDIGGPGHILCALTDDEWKQIKAGRETDDGI